MTTIGNTPHQRLSNSFSSSESYDSGRDKSTQELLVAKSATRPLSKWEHFIARVKDAWQSFTAPKKSTLSQEKIKRTCEAFDEHAPWYSSAIRNHLNYQSPKTNQQHPPIYSPNDIFKL